MPQLDLFIFGPACLTFFFYWTLFFFLSWYFYITQGYGVLLWRWLISRMFSGEGAYIVTFWRVGGLVVVVENCGRYYSLGFLHGASRIGWV